MKLMQFTGLCDKNGREIYEGDFIHCIVDVIGRGLEDLGIRRVHWYEKEVRWELTQWGKDEAFWSHYIMSQDHWIYEVIGNVYENPELMK